MRSDHEHLAETAVLVQHDEYERYSWFACGCRLRETMIPLGQPYYFVSRSWRKSLTD